MNAGFKPTFKVLTVSDTFSMAACRRKLPLRLSPGLERSVLLAAGFSFAPANRREVLVSLQVYRNVLRAEQVRISSGTAGSARFRSGRRGHACGATHAGAASFRVVKRQKSLCKLLTCPFSGCFDFFRFIRNRLQLITFRMIPRCLQCQWCRHEGLHLIRP